MQLKFLLLFLPFYFAYAEPAEVWKELPDFSCEGSESVCFEKASEVLKEAFVSYKGDTELFTFNSMNLEYPYQKEKNVGRYFLTSEKSPLAIVFVHGLFGSDAQFATLSQRAFHDRLNVIHVVLPGHGLDWASAPEVKPSQWQDSLRRAVNLARFLGQRVILFGQSTGGLLSLLQAIDSPKSVDGLILMEPALKVNPGKEGVACFSKVFARFAHDAPGFAKLLGYDLRYIPKSVSPQMACQVAQMRKGILERYQISENSEDSVPASIELANRVNIPTMVLTPPKDEVVSNEDNQAFARRLIERGLGMSYVYEKNYGHGAFQLYDPPKLAELFQSYLQRFFQLNQIRASVQLKIKNSDRLLRLAYFLRLSSALVQIVDTELARRRDELRTNFILTLSIINPLSSFRYDYAYASNYTSSMRVEDLYQTLEQVDEESKLPLKLVLDRFFKLVVDLEKHEKLSYTDRKPGEEELLARVKNVFGGAPLEVRNALVLLQSKWKVPARRK